MTDITLAYGRDGLRLRLPAAAEPTVIRKKPLPRLSDPAAAVAAAFDQPIGSPSLAELARGRTSACVVICDITRPVPNQLFLRPMIEVLLAGGIPADRIVIVVATGLHRGGDAAELAELVGHDQWVLDHIRIVNHDARDRAGLVDLGLTPNRAVPVSLNRRLVEADLRIVTGLVEPHFMAGWSGGRKVVAPGVAGADTIRTFHSARFMGDPLAVEANLVGNPLHEEQLAIVAKLGQVYALNTVIDEDRGLSYVNFGDIQASHQAAVDVAAGYTVVDCPERFATVVTSAAGYPLDKTYYQTVKAMVTARDILAPGGTMIVASELSEGLGSPDFRAAQRRLIELGPDRFLASLWSKSMADVDEWETQMLLKPAAIGRIQLYTTGLTAADRADTAVELVDSLDQAVAAALAESGDQRLAVIPEGPYVIPRFRPAVAR